MVTPAFSDCVNKLGVDENDVIPFGRNKAKISLEVLDKPAAPGKLILVSAITPTPSGEGKTTVSIGLAQGLQAIGKKACLALRQPSMGPVFGRKGGATGGGKSSLTPPDEINMHFTGDFHAITSAHNLISAIIDNAMFFHTLNIDERKVTWKRVMDMNDRSLRSIIVGLNKQGFPRETGFDITPASEIMACLCLATSCKDMEDRINRIVIGFTTDDKPVFARELGITGSVMALLKDALMPNLVQTVEGVPCFLHGGPFANIAHGCNSVLATKMALHFGDYAVTEAGFAFDLGAEKFLDIKCRQSGLDPAAIVIVATARALKMHGGTALADLKNTDVAALKKGLANLDAHLDAAAHYKRPVVVAVNKFFDDSQEELDAIVAHCAERGIPCAIADIFSQGGEGGKNLAQMVVEAADKPSAPFKPLYESALPVEEKLNIIARSIYGADGVELTPAAKKKLAQFEASRLT
ncbi:formate--tetrahydrofolate ligase, partial [Akkermansia sp.]